MWMDLEEAMPGRKIDFYQGFLERGRPAFRTEEQAMGDELHPCPRCGYPTSAGVCGVCRIRDALKETV